MRVGGLVVTRPLETAKLAFTTAVPPVERSTVAVIVWAPSAIRRVSKGAAAAAVPPARSYGAYSSVWKGERDIPGSST